MAKTRNMISENLKLVDVVIELADCRIPYSSRNPDIDTITGTKPKILVLAKSDMADSAATEKWLAFYKSKGLYTLAANCISPKGTGEIKRAIDFVLKDKIKRDLKKGFINRPAKIMVVGIPNVGKSSFINKLSRRAGAKTGDKPGITKGKQWIKIHGGYELLDTPGVLWPRFDEKTGLYLAYTGAIKKEVYDTVQAGTSLCLFLAENYPENIVSRYTLPDIAGKNEHEILSGIAKSRGCIKSGGEIDTERAAIILLDEFRSGRLGNITLELPSDIQ